jgi:protein-S-isoprenylcysteine O-methyltransferase Ste14
MAKRFGRWAFATFIVAILVFALAGTLRDAWLWAYVGVWSTASAYALLGMDEELAKERFRPPTAGADGVAMRFLRVAALSHLIVGALDAGRWHLNSPLPAAVRGAALAGMAAGLAMFYRAMRENRFFSSVVRLQTERGHRVIDSGPYRTVRHPGYAGLVLMPPLSGLALGSWLAAGIGAAISLMVIRRVLLEDSFLRAHLDGYVSYAQRVPHRLIPGVW